MKQPKISYTDLRELIHWARRYCDGRATFTASEFNRVLRRLYQDNEEVINKCPEILDKQDDAVEFYPWAQDGMFCKETGDFDVRPRNKKT